MLKSKLLSLVLDIDFMTLTISFTFLEFIIYLRASLQNFVENHQYNVILSYFKQNLNIHLFNITYLHTTCTRLLKYVDFSWNWICHQNLLGFVDGLAFKMPFEFSLHKIQS